MYRRLLTNNQFQLAREERLDTWLGHAKVAIFLSAALALFHTADRLVLLFIPAVLFVALAVAHERILRSLRLRKRVIEFYSRGVARLEDRWAGKGEAGVSFLDAAHPYARDLDLFGEGSLFELLCTVRTRAGEVTLARWLLHAAPPDEVRARQEAITELKDQLRFRETLFVAGESVRLGVRPEALTAWGEREDLFPFRRLAPVLPALALLWVGTAAYALATYIWQPLLLMSIVNLGVSLALRPRVTESVKAFEKATEDLKVLSKILEILEGTAFETPRLQNLRASLHTTRITPSTAVRRLGRIVDWLESRRNPIVAQFSPFLFYTIGLAIAAERWRMRFGPRINGWLSAVGEFEALSSLAAYASEHPTDVMPVFVDQPACFEAVGLAHPLLPESMAVRNDLTLGSELQLIVISGPNMAGKSTFLRGVGLNVVLAQCGAPVRAVQLRLSSLAVGASICVLDSLQGGVSRFYAEIKRLSCFRIWLRGRLRFCFFWMSCSQGPTRAIDSKERDAWSGHSFGEAGSEW